MRLLLKAGADVNKASTDNGVTPLLIAAEEGHEAIVRLLLDAGANFNTALNNGTTPLDIAQREGHTEIVTLLTNASVDAKNALWKNGESCPICFNKYVSHTDIELTTCSHNMCRTCKDALVKSVDNPLCPMCRNPNPFGNGRGE